MRASRAADLWWRVASIYCVDVEKYADSDGDGIGDFRGLTERVEHLDRLGVTCIWLMPFYPTANRDDGYDITDYYSIDPRLGTLGDFVEFMRTARHHGMRVIADLVVNHTSDQHPWFQASKSSSANPYRDWYVWRDRPPEEGPKGEVFPGEQNGVWTKHRGTGQYYLHRFYPHQPDLNVTNSAVRDEIARILGFWMELGLSGFRVDAVPFLLETEGTVDPTALSDPHDFLRDLRAFMHRRNGESVLLGEVNLPYQELQAFFGEDADELTMCFDFVGMQAMYLALARRDASPLAHALRDRPAAPQEGQWATFIRNHDELTLDKLTRSERQEVFDAFGPQEDMQIFDRGLRRRLPPMLDGDLDRIKMVYSMLYSLPGTPVLFYGEEIGMGENLDVPGRLAVRTPMQWAGGPTAGFTTADPGEMVLPVPDGEYGPDHVSVAQQLHDPDSLMAWMQMVNRRFRECPALGLGEVTVYDLAEPAVLAHQLTADGDTVLVLHHLDEEPVDVVVPVTGLDDGAELCDMLHRGPGLPEPHVIADGEVKVHLGRYGCRWLRLTRHQT
ncbi:MAG TPA: alpha-amylase family protein [Ilumatobacter sp.]|nr:alpha-amylase family protein [Ilumatobacter sp.]